MTYGTGERLLRQAHFAKQARVRAERARAYELEHGVSWSEHESSRQAAFASAQRSQNLGNLIETVSWFAITAAALVALAWHPWR